MTKAFNEHSVTSPPAKKLRSQFSSETAVESPRTQHRSCPCGGGCPHCRAAAKALVDAGLKQMPEGPGRVLDVLRSPGVALDADTQTSMEKRFGRDFKGVRVHYDGQAHESARKLSALAYTVGQDIVFSQGQYAPASVAGQSLLAHELTHVVQQTTGVVGTEWLLEAEAETAANHSLPTIENRTENQPVLRLQRQPAPGSANPNPAMAEAEAELETILGASNEDLSAQAVAEAKLKLKSARSGDIRYAQSIAVKDRDRIRKHGISPQFQGEITVKLSFFEDRAKAAYISVISGALSEYPDQATEILDEAKHVRGAERLLPPKELSELQQQRQETNCDLSLDQYPLLDEMDPYAVRCMDVKTDKDYRDHYFDKNLLAPATGFAVEGTTWENVEYGRIQIMLVHYKNGTSEYFVLDEMGNFYFGGQTLVTLDHAYIKRRNGLIYPLYGGSIYINEILAPNLLALKNGLRYQVTQLQELYRLLQLGGTFASILGQYSVTEGFRHSIEGSSKPSSELPKAARTQKALPPGAPAPKQLAAGTPAVEIDMATGLPRQIFRQGEIDIGPAYHTFEEAYAAKSRPTTHITENIVSDQSGNEIARWWESSESLAERGVHGEGRLGDTEQKALLRVRLERGMTMEIRGAHTPCTVSGGCDVAMQSIARRTGARIIYRTISGATMEYPRREF